MHSVLSVFSTARYLQTSEHSVWTQLLTVYSALCAKYFCYNHSWITVHSVLSILATATQDYCALCGGFLPQLLTDFYALCVEDFCHNYLRITVHSVWRIFATTIHGLLCTLCGGFLPQLLTDYCAFYVEDLCHSYSWYTLHSVWRIS